MGLFSSSDGSGRLLNITTADYGAVKKKATVSVGNVPLGIYKQGPKRRRAAIFHDPQQETVIYQLFRQLKNNGNYYASLRNFKETTLLNFTADDLFLTLTFNNRKGNLKFKRAPWGERACYFPNCQKSEHYYQTVDPSISSFLAEKRIAKKRLGRDQDGVNDLLIRFIQDLQAFCKPVNFR